MTRKEIDRLLKLLARAKAVWMDQNLLNLTESAGTPTNAYDIVFKQTGKRRKALAARWYAVARRDFHPDLVGACVRWLRYPHWSRGSKQLRIFLTNALAEDEQKEEQHGAN